MDFLEQRGLPLTEENLAAWQRDLEIREDLASGRNQILRRQRDEIRKEYVSLKKQEEMLFKKRAAKSSQAWSRPIWARKNVYELVIIVNIIMFILSKIFPSITANLSLFGPAVFQKHQLGFPLFQS